MTTPIRLERVEFLTDFWDYRAGHMVTILGPTGCGKTVWSYQLLDAACSEKLPAVSLVMKPKDVEAARWNKALGLRTVRQWPPLPSIWKPRKPRGWCLWPKHTFDPDKDDELLYREFRKAILDSYRRGNRILFGDEVYGLCELGLEKELKAVWSRGRAMGTGLWAASQRPSHIPLLAYSSAEHLFLFRDPDKRTRDRFKEIGGVDPDIVGSAVFSLAPYECLYIKRTGGEMCIIGA